MAKSFPFVAGQIAYRNTWKNQYGNMRSAIYPTEEVARLSAMNTNKSAKAVYRGDRVLYQEIATPVEASACLIEPLDFYDHE